MDERLSVLALYGLDSDVTFSSAPGGFNNNWVVETRTGRYFLKRRSPKHKERTSVDCEVSAHLNSKGVPTARPLRTTNGSLVVDRGEFNYAVFTYLDGNRYTDTPENLTAAGRTLSILHQTLADYKGPLGIKGDAIDWMKRNLNDHGNDELADVASQRLSEDERVLKRAKLRHGVIHWDYHGGNMKVHNKILYPLDFEFAHRDAYVMDIANSLICLAALNPDTLDYSDATSFVQPCRLNKTKARTFLAAYGGLTKEELEVLPEAMDVAWLGWVLYTLSTNGTKNFPLDRATYFSEWVKINAGAIRRVME